MAKTMPISEVKTRLPELVHGVAEREEEIVVTRRSGRTESFNAVIRRRLI